MAAAANSDSAENRTYALFDHPGPNLRFSFLAVREDESNRQKAKQQEQNMERLRSATHEGLVLEYTRIKSWGIRATRKFLNGDLVLKYCGELMSEKKGFEVERKLVEKGIDDSFLYFFKFDSKYLCLDATADDGSYGRLVNHSRLRPNCKAAGIMLGREQAVALFAIRDIRAGEEILYDYGETRPEVLARLPWIENS